MPCNSIQYSKCKELVWTLFLSLVQTNPSQTEVVLPSVNCVECTNLPPVCVNINMHPRSQGLGNEDDKYVASLLDSFVPNTPHDLMEF
jgi:hypothetical protein